MQKIFRNLMLVFLLFMLPAFALAEGIGKIKVISGQVSIERLGETIPAVLGAAVFQTDKIITGKESSVGLLFNDDSRLSAGPNSTLALDKFNFDPVTNDGNFDVSLKKGTLSVISGKLTQKTPGALKVKTPAAILAVRGTEFAVKVEEPTQEQEHPQ